MASAYSTPKQFDNYVEPVNLELVNFVLQSKEQKFNYNIAKVEQTLADFGNLGLVRDQDKEYLVDRVSQMTSQMGNLGKVDWSDSNVERQITAGIKGSIDDRVLNDVQMSRKYSSFQKEVAAIKEKGKGGYQDSNVLFALHESGADKWINGEAGSFGNLKYDPFTDVAANYKEILDESISMKHGITREVEDPTNGTRYIESTHYGLMEAEIRAKVGLNLTPQEQKQLRINSWYSLGDEGAMEAYDSYVKPRVTELTTQRDTLKLNFKGKSDAEKAIAKKGMSDIDAQLASIQSKKDNPAAVHSYLGYEGLIAGLSATYAPVETSFKYNDNPAARKAAENAAKNIAGAMGTSDYNEDGVYDVQTVSKITNVEERNLIASKNADKELANYEGQIKSVLLPAYNRLDATEKAKFDTAYTEYLKENDLQNNASNKNAFMLENSNNGMGEYYTATEVATASRLNSEYKRKHKIKTDNFAEAFKDGTANTEATIFKSVKEKGSNIKMTDENGKVVMMSDYLKGYENLTDLPEGKRKQFLSSAYVDLTLSQTKNHDESKGDVNGLTEFNITQIASIEGELDKSLPMLVNPEDIFYRGYSENKDFAEVKKDMGLPSQMTQEQFNTHIKPLLDSPDVVASRSSGAFLSDIPFIGKTAEKIYVNMGRDLGDRAVSDNIIIGGEGTKTRAALERGLANETYDQPSWGTDSVEDIGEVISLGRKNRKEVQESYEAKMGEDADNFAQNNKIVIQQSGTREGQDIPVYNELVLLSGGKLEPKGGVINVEETPDGEGYLVYQYSEELVTKDGMTKAKGERREVVIKKRDLGKKYQHLNQYIKNQSDNKRITTGNTKEITSNKITFADETSQRKYVLEVGKMFGATTEKELSAFTAQGAKKNIKAKHSALFNSNGGAVYNKLATQIIDNAHLFRVNVTANDRDLYDFEVQYKDDVDGEMVWTTLKTMPAGTDDMTNTAPMIDTAPQVFLYTYMDKLFTNIGLNGSADSETELKKLRKIFPQ